MPVTGLLLILEDVDDLRDDPLLLGTRSDDTLALPDKLRFALSGAELVQLTATGRVNVPPVISGTCPLSSQAMTL
jgi:hypothetical protein